jgi:hypothetical protein
MGIHASRSLFQSIFRVMPMPRTFRIHAGHPWRYTQFNPLGYQAYANQIY